MTIFRSNIAVILFVALFTFAQYVSVNLPLKRTVGSKFLVSDPSSSFYKREKNNNSKNCLNERGWSGRWVHDWDYANRTNYRMEGSYSNWHIASQKFQPTEEQPFRFATAWKWQDDNKECPVQETTLSGFCHAAAKLDLTRVLIMGDSLSIQFMFSLLSLLGFPLKGFRTSFNGMLNRPFHIPCNHVQVVLDEDRTKNQTIYYDSFQVSVWMYRRSPLSDFAYLQQEVDSNGTLTNQQRAFVRDNPNRTAIVANTGSWMHDMEDYKQAFHSILDWIDSFDTSTKSKIVAFFRPTIPGHLNCTPQHAANTTTTTDEDWATSIAIRNNAAANFNWTHSSLHQSPCRDHDEYMDTTRQVLLDETKNSSSSSIIDTYNWLDFEVYNTYSQQVLENRSRNNNDNATRTATIHWINIYNSSVLRRDGHVGFGDCLHYYNPGPTDWWVHFFYSMLLDLSSEEA